MIYRGEDWVSFGGELNGEVVVAVQGCECLGCEA